MSAFRTRRLRDAPSVTTYRRLLSVLQAARQQQIGDVGASHQQHTSSGQQ